MEGYRDGCPFFHAEDVDRCQIALTIADGFDKVEVITSLSNSQLHVESIFLLLLVLDGSLGVSKPFVVPPSEPQTRPCGFLIASIVSRSQSEQISHNTLMAPTTQLFYGFYFWLWDHPR